jgi:hypothetical protein
MHLLYKQYLKIIREIKNFNNAYGTDSSVAFKFGRGADRSIASNSNNN